MSYRRVGRKVEKRRRKVSVRRSARPVSSKKELKKLRNISGRTW